ncbi:hypothetical protein AVEN_169760-1 [Araneus ventricosus]|uniref:Uncharacterized protein n=1 Tax=Araneus ventricosus TaxID=182803 RepID=A0A4Y2HLH7_ARAVE|nr:hypothetical protein AVEN_169760-1 [Araneus ventricosus]
MIQNEYKNVVLSCGHDVHECCARHLDLPSSLCLRCMKPLTDDDTEKIRRVSKDDDTYTSMDDDTSSTNFWTDSSTDSDDDSSMDASIDECFNLQAM